MSKNSAFHWLPIVQKAVPDHIPKTVLIKFSEEDIFNLFMFPFQFANAWKDKIYKESDAIGYPLFMKSDEVAFKHNWKNACFIEKRENIISHLQNIAIHSENIHVKMHGIMLREFLHLQSPFTFFYGDMPVSKERRYFVKDNKVICHHAYWDASVFEDTFDMDDKTSFDSLAIPKKYSPEHREKIRSMLKEINTETEDEIAHLTKIANKVAKAFKGEAWSVDFACDIHGKWWLIDAAIASDSWHPKSCKHYDTLSVKKLN